MMMRSGPSWAGISSDSTSTPSARGDRVGPRGMPQRSAEDTGRAERVHGGAYVIEAAKRAGKVAVVLQFQGGTPLDYNANLVEAFYRLGVRVIQLTYNERNPLGDGCTERTDAGLSDLGVRVIAEMNRLGVAVDLSHVGYRTSMEAIEASAAPVIFSHSNARAVCDSARNLTDDQMRAAAARGGVIGVNAFPAFVARHQAPTVEHLLDHIEYMVRVVGDDHVGLGFDFS